MEDYPYTRMAKLWCIELGPPKKPCCSVGRLLILTLSQAAYPHNLWFHLFGCFGVLWGTSCFCTRIDTENSKAPVCLRANLKQVVSCISESIWVQRSECLRSVAHFHSWLSMKDKLDLRESEKPEKLSAFPLKFRAIRPCLLNVAERRTPGCRFSTWGMWNRRRCVVTLGSEDLRVYIADHKPPTVFNLKRLHVRRGQRHLELSRSSWMTKVFQRLCCCEPLSCTITLRLDQVGKMGEVNVDEQQHLPFL